MFYSVRSRLQFAAKHLDTVSNAMVWMVSLTIEPLVRSVMALWHRSARELGEVWSGYRQLYRWMLR